MSDIEEFAEELNNQDPIDIDYLMEAFDEIFYSAPKGEKPVEAKHVSGLTIRSPENIENLVEKLSKAKEADPRFMEIGGQSFKFDSEDSLSKLIDGIRIGIENE